MNYFEERSLYYFFLMGEITNVDNSAFGHVAKLFGLKPREIKKIEAVLDNATLTELSTVGDIEMYKNYLDGYCGNEDEFGNASLERKILDVKALALQKTVKLFGEAFTRGDMIKALSHTYDRDHTSAVLYALSISLTNDSESRMDFVRSILMKELRNGKNSDAGIVLLKLVKSTDEVMAELCDAPDLLLRPDVLKVLTKRYGGGEQFGGKRTIGF